MSNPSDFIIENGVLKKYKGPGGDVEIPESVTSIGDKAFYDCRSLTDVTIPESVTSIGDWAFYDCRSLTDVTIPDGVTSIGRSAFYNCRSLTDVTIPDGVTSIGDWAFSDCSSLASVTIPESVTSIGNGVFSDCSSLGSVVIPESVTSIGDGAFYGCKKLSDAEGFVILRNVLYSYHGSLASVTIPEGVTDIGPFAFSSCSKLNRMIIPEGVHTIGERAFIFCHGLKEISLPGSLSVLGEGVFLDCKGITEVTLPDHFIKSTKKLPAELSKATRKMDSEQLAWILFAQTAKRWREDAMTAAADKDKQQIFGDILAIMREQKKIGTAVAANSLETFKSFRQALPDKMMKEYVALLKEKQCEKQLLVLRSDPDFQSLLSSPAEKDHPQAEKIVLDNLAKKQLNPDDVLDILKETMGLTSKDLPSLLSFEREECVPCVLAWLLTVHDLNSKDLTLRPDSARVISLLDQKSWQDALIRVATLASKFDGSSKKTNLLYPVSLYASEMTMDTLTRQAYKWGRRSQEVFHEACCLSDTRTAMLFAERHKTLDLYASLRGTDADTLRDTVLADFGLDDNGTKKIDLGNGTVTIKLMNDLKLELFDDQTGKSVKSIPKKSADPEKYEAAKEELALMKKNIRNAVKRRFDRLFEAFLSGAEDTKEKWAAVYLGNPVLNQIAKILVWEQDGAGFTVTEDGAVDCFGRPYTLTDSGIRLAHPMEQSLAEVRAWQNYFTSKALKQPFLQIWEPVANPQEIRPDRYQGAAFSVYRFTGKEKHGIKSFDLYDYSTSFGFALDDCKLEYTPSVERFRRGVTDDAFYTLGLFSFQSYTRKVNHIVSILDKWTAEDRIKKDDPSIVNQLDSFTLAQITEFIAAAQEANAVNVLALLLEYKNAHFADFDPMDEFTLEW